MARRVVMGNIPGVGYDVRISRPGYDALTANVNDIRQISFSANRAGSARVAAAGEFGAMDAWHPLGHAYPAPPPILVLLKRGGYVMTDTYEEYPRPQGYQRGSGFTIVVQTSQILATAPSQYGFALGAGDKYIYYSLTAD